MNIHSLASKRSPRLRVRFGLLSLLAGRDHPVMATVSKINHNHVSADPAIFSGKPCIAGTRIRVQDVYVWHELQGQSADEIVASLPQLTHADVYATLAYFWDHRDEMHAEMQRDDRLIEEAKLLYISKLESDR